MSAGAMTPAAPDTVHVVLELTSPPDSLLLGQPFEVLGSIPLAGLRALSLTTPAGTLDPFELAGWQRALDRGDTAVVRMTFQPFEVGALMLPALSVEGETADGAICLAVSDSMPVEVVSIVPGDATELLDIKEAVAPERPASPWPWIAAGTALIVVLAILSWLRARRRRGGPERVLAARPAHEVALDALAALAARGVPATGPWKPYYTELTDILRGYVARRFGVDALDLTSTEILRALEHAELDSGARDALRAVLREADAVKFAKAVPADDTPRRHLAEARRFVRATAPSAHEDRAQEPMTALEARP